MKWLTHILYKNASTGEFSTRDQKVKAGIEFTIKTYGETFKDLARYDKGEQFSS